MTRGVEVERRTPATSDLAKSLDEIPPETLLQLARSTTCGAGPFLPGNQSFYRTVCCMGFSACPIRLFMRLGAPEVLGCRAATCGEAPDSGLPLLSRMPGHGVRVSLAGSGRNALYLRFRPRDVHFRSLCP